MVIFNLHLTFFEVGETNYNEKWYQRHQIYVAKKQTFIITFTFGLDRTFLEIYSLLVCIRQRARERLLKTI